MHFFFSYRKHTLSFDHCHVNIFRMALTVTTFKVMISDHIHFNSLFSSLPGPDPLPRPEERDRDPQVDHSSAHSREFPGN